jgi:hypothetical protein
LKDKVIRSFFAAAIAFVPLLIAACASQQPARLDADESKLLRSIPTIVFYADSEAPLDVYVSLPKPPPLPVSAETVKRSGQDSSYAPGFGFYQGALPAAAAALTGALIVSHYANAARDRIKPFQPLILKMGVTDEQYAAAKDVLGSVTWLKDVPWQRLHTADETHAINAYMRQPGPRAVILLEPFTKLRDDANQIVTGYQVKIYVKDPFGLLGGSNLRENAAVGSAWTSDQAHGYPTIDYQKHDQDDLMDKTVPQFFSDGGARFQQGFETTLAGAKSQLTYYFSSDVVSPPAKSN